MKVRQMCGGGTWRREHWKPRRASGAVIFDAPGVAVVYDASRGDWGPFTWRLHAYASTAEWLGVLVERVAWRIGYADRRNPRHPFRRTGRGWIRVGPWVLGNVAAFDRSGCP